MEVWEPVQRYLILFAMGLVGLDNFEQTHAMTDVNELTLVDTEDLEISQLRND